MASDVYLLDMICYDSNIAVYNETLLIIINYNEISFEVYNESFETVFLYYRWELAFERN